MKVKAWDNNKLVGTSIQRWRMQQSSDERNKGCVGIAVFVRRRGVERAHGEEGRVEGFRGVLRVESAGGAEGGEAPLCAETALGVDDGEEEVVVEDEVAGEER